MAVPVCSLPCLSNWRIFYRFKRHSTLQPTRLSFPQSAAAPHSDLRSPTSHSLQPRFHGLRCAVATAQCSQGSHPSLLPSMATLRTPSRRRAYHHADRPWIGGAYGLYGLSQTRRRQDQRCNDLQIVGTSVPSSAAMVTGMFTQRRYRGGEEDTVFTVSNQSKRPDPICFTKFTPLYLFIARGLW